MNEPVLLIGGGGHGLVVGEAVLARCDQFELLGLVDPDPRASTAGLLGVPHLGDDSVLADHPTASVVLGVGAVGGVGQRPAIVEQCGDDRRWPPVVHPTAHVSPSAELGRGAVVLPGAVVHAAAVVGDFAVVNTGAIVEHDVIVGRHTLVGPGATIGGGTVLGDAVSVGLGASLRDSIRVGAEAVVAMGAVIVTDVAAGVRAFGVTAPRMTGRDDP